MGYTFDCDGPCGRSYHDFPPFAGEFTEQFLKTRGGLFAEEFAPGEKVTICADCMEDVVLTPQSGSDAAAESGFESDGHETRMG